MNFYFLIVYKENVRLQMLDGEQNVVCFFLMHPGSKLSLTTGRVIK